MDTDSKTFVIYVAMREQEKTAIHPDRKAQIEAQRGVQSGAQIQDKAQVRALLFDKAPTEVPIEYCNYNNVFSAENTAELPENTGINEYAIELEEDKQLPFELIYNLSLVELETLKTYIKTNLANSFIWPFKYPAGPPMLFDEKPNRSLRFCVDY